MKTEIQFVYTQYFRDKLLRWNKHHNHRTMPWKGEKDPYKIWLSEIILQQTRVDQGLKYYEKFILNYPTIADLANAFEDDVLKDWEGLGYYSRCRNLIWTAKYIHHELNGSFPDVHNEILSLKGVGPYTAAAIASFAFNQPYAVVDGNVVRVLSRFTGTSRLFVSSQDKLFYQQMADQFLSKKKPAEYNQAIMDFGATLCKPAKPDCPLCPLKAHCVAYIENRVEELPLRKKAVKLKKRYFHYLLVEKQQALCLRKRQHNDIWQSLYEPVLIEQTAKPAWLKKTSLAFKIQKLSHQELCIHFYKAKCSDMPTAMLEGYELVPKHELPNKAYSKSVFDFLKEFDYI